VKRARRREAKLARRIERAREGGDAKAVARLCDVQARSFHCRLAAAWEMNRRRKPRDRFSPTRLIEVAANAHPGHVTGRAVKVKKGGKDRAAVDPSPSARVIQGVFSARLKFWMVRQLHPAQFKFQGGRHKACAKVLEHMGLGGWCLVLDVKNFYGTCDAESLAAMVERVLHLRPGMARAALCASAIGLGARRRAGRPTGKPARQRRGFYLFNPKAARALKKAGGEGKGGQPPKEEAAALTGQPTSTSPGIALPTGSCVPYSVGGSQRGRQTKTTITPTVSRRGLMTGSPASDLVAEFIISVVLKALPKCARAVCFADNIIVFCRTRKEAREVKEALSRALAQSPAGALTFGTKRIVKLGKRFEFCGYDFYTLRGIPTAAPTDENQRIIWDRFAGHVKRGHYAKARRSIDWWVPQFNLWPVIDDWKHDMLSEVDYAEAGRWEGAGGG
jgi:hypothetical protein